MAKYFEYTKVHDTYKARGAGLPGQFTTDAGMTTFAAIANEDLEAGQAVELVATTDGTIKVQTCTAVAKLAGIVLLDVHAQKYVDNLTHQFIHSVKKGETVTVLRKGYVWVPVEDDTETINRDGSVYLRTVASSTNTKKAVGGIGSAEVSSENAVVSAMKFTGQVGYPLSGKQLGTTSEKITNRTAEVKIELGLL